MKIINPTAAVLDYVKRFPTQRDAAKALGVSPAYLSDLVNGRRDVSDSMADKLGLRHIYVKGDK